MRTKKLILAAAALAVSLASSQAQSNVYSVNIVGYINVPLTTANTLLSNPFDDGTNTLVSIDKGVLPNGSAVNTWNGTGFNATSKARGAWSSNPTIGVPAGFFVKPAAATTWTQWLQ